MVALKYAVMMNGVTELIMMKSDVLDDFDTIRVATSYKQDGKEIDWFPYDGAENVEPVYQDFKGWKTSLCDIRSYEALPQAFKEYVAFIEKACGVPVRIISVGPDREAVICR